MSASSHAIRVGLRRGLILFRISLRNPEDLIFYLMWGGGVLAFLFFSRNAVVEGTDLTLTQVALPGTLAAMAIFGGVVGPAFALVTEREDGTLLRLRSAPHGIKGYVTGEVVLEALGTVPMLLIIIAPTAFFVDGLMHRGVLGWVVVAALLLLGLAVAMPLGMIIGSLARKPAHVSTWGLLPVIGLAAISGIVTPLTQLAGWLQVLAQAFPMYWLGHGLRWAFLPDDARVLEVGEQWRILEALGVLGLWVVLGLVVAPRVLRRMARRESGSAVEARMHERLQRIG